MKKQHRSPPFKLLSLLLALAMLFCMIPVSAVALESETAITETAQVPSASPSQGESSAEEILGESAPEEALGLGELSTEVLATMEVNAEDIPEVIPMARAQEKGLVNRLYAQEESLSTVLFQTKSGSKTAYVFDKPVKYVDANGAVRDKSTAITGILNTTYAYGMLDNNVKVYFPRNITSGVLLSYNDYSITMSPEVSGSYAAFYAQEENAVTYADVFGERTILSYTPTLYGVKEDIILVSYTGKNSFDFIMEQQGLTAVQNDGVWQLVNAADQVVAGLGSVIVKDSAGKTAMGELTLTPLAGGKYRVTVTAPEDFLTAEDTVYPVYVDPTVSVEDREEREYYDEEGYYTDGEIDTIIDVGLYDTASGYDDATDYPYEHYLGQKSGGTGRIIYKFYDFYDDNGEFTNMNSGQIGKVTMYLSTYDEPSQSVLVRPMTATWNTTTYGENPVALLNSNVNLWNAVSGVGMSTFDIEGYSVYTIDLTQIVKGWLDYNQGISSEAYHNPANGFCLSADDDYYSYVMSTEGDTVYYEVEYGYLQGDYYLLSMAHGDVYEFYMPYMEEEGDYLLSSETYANITDLDDAKWTFECCGDDLYYIRLASDPSCVLYAYDNSIYATQFVEGSPYQQWEIIQSGATYYIKNKGEQKYLYYGPRSYYYTYQLSATVYGTTGAKWNLVDADIFVPLTDISLDSEWLEAGTTKNFNVVAAPSNASHTSDMYFIWEFSNSDFTVDTSGRITADVYDGEFTYVTLTHKYTGKSATVWIGTPITSSTGTDNFGWEYERYLIRNKGSHNFLHKVEDAYSQQEILESNGSAFWKIEHHQSEMDYQIKLFSTENLLVVDKDGIVNTVGNVNVWRIGSCGDDSYYIFSDENPHKVLGFDNSNSGSLRLYDIEEADQYCKWEFKIVENNVNLQVWYDGCFSDIYVDDVNDITEEITGIMKKLQTVYAWNFGILVDYDTTPDSFNSLLDRCSTKASDECTCDDQHHTFAENIIEDISNVPLPDIYTVRMMFTGHASCSQETCDFEDDFNEILDLDGATLKSAGVCIVTYDQSFNQMCRTAIHEFGHFYDGETFESDETLLDHYDWYVGNNDPDGYEDECIYGAMKATLTDIVICPGCKNVIQGNCDWYNHN